jgi:iron complex transport system substrate-binding protein
VLALAVAAPSALARPAPVTDDRGKVLRLHAPARRIAVLAPHLVELAFDAGAGSALVGAVRGSDHPAEATRLPVIGDAAGLDVERILALRPDLVLGWRSGNRASDIERLERLGLPVFLSEPRRLRDVPETLRRVGTLAGTRLHAERAAQAFEARLARLAVTAAPSSVSVFVEIWHSPLMTVNGAHLISDVLAACGGRNVFAGMPALAGSVSVESVLAADPEVIIAATPPGQDVLAAWRALPRLRAVQAGRLHAVDPDLLTRATPRILDGVERVCRWLARDQVSGIRNQGSVGSRNALSFTDS